VHKVIKKQNVATSSQMLETD